jgi:PAS domain S-box-containing protein
MAALDQERSMTVAPARMTSLEEVLAQAPRDRASANGARTSPRGDPRELQLLEALRAVRRGNFDVRLSVAADGADGRWGEIAEAFNDIVDANRQALRELRRIQRSVGRAGRIRERADPAQLAGDWDAMLGAVNQLLDDVTAPTIEVSRVLDAVARGDLAQRLSLELDGRPLRGEFKRSREVVNTMVDQLNAFASEVTRVAREVGTEGKLGGQAEVKGVAGTWKDLTDSVNSMASNLTAQVRNIAEVTTAVARGDLSKKITVDVRGEILELKNTINTMVDQLNAFASEVTRVAREVGTEGKLGGQADVRDVGGTWKDLTDTVNSMAGNLTAQVRNIAEVTTAVAKGDLSKKITVDVQGEILELKNTINTMVDELGVLALEVTRVAHEVGTEGILGGQAEVPAVAGTWKELTDNVNTMSTNLTKKVRDIAEVTTAVANGDLSRKLTVDVKGEFLAQKNTINTMVDQLNAFAFEVTRVAREVGTEGKLGGQAEVRGVAGTWKDLTDNVNFMARNLTDQVRNIAEVTTAVAGGDLSKKISVDANGEIAELKSTINTMVDQLNAFASEVTRVAREVGTEGKLGGQAEVKGVAGTWKDLTDSVNSMAGNLTAQVRNIAEVTTAVAKGDLSKKITVKAQGEIAELADTINGMTATLALFAAQVTTVAREVGSEGKLGGQAEVPGAAGTWQDLTQNVNRLAANLTEQVRAIGEVATAVTRGDLTRTIAVGAAGEVGVLKDDINEMIRKLRETTQENQEQDWLKSNLARFSRLLQGQRNPATVGRLVLTELAPLIGVQHGAFYLIEQDDQHERYVSAATYAAPEHVDPAALVQGLVGQCARDRQRILLTDVPGDYIAVTSGLGSAPPRSIVLVPVVVEDRSRAVIELASFTGFGPIHLAFLDQLAETVGIAINSIDASQRSEQLLREQAARAEAETGLARLRQVVDVMPEGILIADAAGRVYLQNAAAEKIMGTVPEVVMDDLAGKLHRLDGSACEPKGTPLARAVFDGEVVLGEQLVVTNDVSGRDVPILVNSAPLSDGSGRAAGGVTVFQDITPLRDLERQKDEFLAAVSHDLKTPATIIKGRANLLARALARDEQVPTSTVIEGLTSIDESTIQLVRLVDELLDITRWRMGQAIALDLGPADLVKIASRLAVEYRNMSPRHTIDIESNVDRLVGDWDEARIERVLANLLSNAVKYSPRGGGIVIRTSAIDREGEAWAALSVIDHGIGIPAAERDRVFEPYFRGSNVARSISGTGVGLAGTRHIVEEHSGEILVESVPGEGTTFTVLLPLLLDQPDPDEE